MFENEDMILPDDFEMDTTPDETPETEIDAPSEQEETSQEQPPTEEQSNPFLKVKYNKEEMDLDEDRARELAQMGLNYPKLQERLQALESDPRLAFIESLAKQHDMSPQEYMEAVKQQQEQARIQDLVEQGISEELAQEMLENRKFREQYENERKSKAEEERKNAEFKDFFDHYRQVNGKDFNTQTDEIPKAVWEMVESGVPLKFAYMSHENNNLRNQLTTLKQNESNARKAPVSSVTAHGGNKIESEDDFLAGFNSID
jgi:hypothetical protein